MAEPRAIIRTYRPDDEKLVKFTLGLAAMEGLAVANKRGSCISSIDPELMGRVIVHHDSVTELVAQTGVSLVGMVVAAASLRLLGRSDIVRDRMSSSRINRPYFEDAASDLMHRPDFANLQKYYTRSPSSGLFILEYGSKFIGLVAVDASKDSQSEQSFTKKTEKRHVLAGKIDHFYSSGTSSVATIRHFYVEERFRKSNVQQDILAFVARHVFTTAQDVKVIKASATPLLGYKYSSLRELGYSVEKQVGKVGILGWRVDAMSLERARWEKDQNKHSSDL
ncbi:hypothetical protein JVT61DRAFT_5617 [Boletus reticuloceps]|uniref:Uncharacterized protein n=1 Tax=Boletus reticuloceps TaxID=495285 RepID=A0A8I2YXN0_9AGAM|nr:hypothetical protein JVT61DRAFT_5617 [Boletus reticuloceps]